MKPPRIPLPTHLGRFVAELFVIVFGVLIALGAQSWWESRQLEQDRVQTLGLLYDDLTRLESVLRDSVGAAEVDSSIHRLLDDRLPESDSALSRMLADAFWSFGFAIGSRDGEDLLPAYADLKSSGRLALIPDTVRARMPSVELQLVVLSRFLDDLVHFQQTRIDPDLYGRLELTPEGMPPGGDLQFSNLSGVRETLRDRGVRNRLILKSSLLRGQTDLWHETADSVAVVRRLIEAVRGPR